MGGELALDVVGARGRDGAMLALISPAKKLDLEPLGKALARLPATQPELLPEAKTLHGLARKLSRDDLAGLMDLSEDLAELNRERFQNWLARHEPGVNDAKQAILMFAGDVYSGLEASSLDAKTLLYAQDHLAILSGLYGLLRPLDLIQPYRLEMGSKLANKRGKDLYAFWGERIAKAIAGRLAEHADRTVVNLASSEYMKAVPRAALGVPVHDLQFKEIKDGKPVMLMLFAKRARGMMARYLLKERVDRPEGLKDFTAGDYRFDPALSTASEWVFTRAYRKGAAVDPD